VGIYLSIDGKIVKLSVRLDFELYTVEWSRERRSVWDSIWYIAGSTKERESQVRPSKNNTAPLGFQGIITTSQSANLKGIRGISRVIKG
jgi:hypothetical protein